MKDRTEGWPQVQWERLLLLDDKARQRAVVLLIAARTPDCALQANGGGAPADAKSQAAAVAAAAAAAQQAQQAQQQAGGDDGFWDHKVEVPAELDMPQLSAQVRGICLHSLWVAYHCLHARMQHPVSACA